jgi:hypothetical protein
MRPKITPCRNIAKSLLYNELKVTQGIADCLAAANFLKPLPRLSFEDKLRRFERRMDLNERVCTNQHITLNFDPSDSLSNDQMKKIAMQYMKEIGFERQPYLVYRHRDAGHPHCHIVTTHVQKDGDPMELYNIGRNQSEKARQHIEAEFRLVTAEMKKKRREQQQKVDGVQRLKYGEKTLARSMSDILEHVTENYKYTSLKDLNTVLRLYNVEAYRGKEGSQLYQNRGLLYRALDEHGKYIGVPLKASFFDCKPTLNHLEHKFVLNQSAKLKQQQIVATNIQWELRQYPDNLENFTAKLRGDRIHMVLTRDKTGNCKEVAYIKDNCIFNGDELGIHCNRDAIQNLLNRNQIRQEQEPLEQSQKQSQKQTQRQRYRLRQ